MLRAPVIVVALACLSTPAVGFSPMSCLWTTNHGVSSTSSQAGRTCLSARCLASHAMLGSRVVPCTPCATTRPCGGAASTGRGNGALTQLRMNSGDMDDMQPDEQMVERLVEKLETTLEASVQQEQYKDASEIRDELSRMHMDDASAVIQTNSEFYRAFSTKDIELMGKVWRNNQHVQCIHPGAKPLVGYESIVDMWKSMFQARDQVFRSLDISPSDIKVSVRGTTAFVMCTEQVSAPGTQRKMFATNIFRKIAGKWYLVHHHASQATARPATNIEDLLQGSSGSTRVFRIDGSQLRGGDSGADDIVDEIVRALQGALEEEGSRKSPIDLGGAGILGMGQMIVDVDDEDDEDGADGISGTGRDDTRRLDLRDSDTRDGNGDMADDMLLHERELMEGVTDRTVAALRRLAATGQISREAKRKLLGDVIQHHQVGESASEVEIAYELLVMRCLKASASSDDAIEEDELLDDFAEQCRYLAKRV